MNPIIRAHGGRPHWGKVNRLGAEYTRACFPRFAEFAARRKEMDPGNVFANPVLAEAFGK